MDKNKEIPSASYTFNGNVGTLIHHVDTLNMSVDKDMNVQIQNLDQLQAEQPASQPTTSQNTYSTYLIRGKHPFISDDEIQKHLLQAAINGAASLVTYLSTSEAKIALDFREEKPSKIIRTLNLELGTDIKEKTFLTELERKQLTL